MSKYNDLNIARAISDMCFSQMCWGRSAVEKGIPTDELNISCALTYFVTTIDNFVWAIENSDLREEVKTCVRQPWEQTKDEFFTDKIEKNKMRMRLIRDSHDQLRIIISKYDERTEEEDNS